MDTLAMNSNEIHVDLGTIITIVIQLLGLFIAAFAIVRRMDTDRHQMRLDMMQAVGTIEKRIASLEEHKDTAVRWHRGFDQDVPEWANPRSARTWIDHNERRHDRISKKLDDHGRAIDEQGRLIQTRIEDVVHRLDGIVSIPKRDSQ